MDLKVISLNQLETMYSTLGEYLDARRRYEATGQVESLEQERRQVGLELDEARAQLAAQKELAGRLMVALKLTTTNGHGGATSVVAAVEQEAVEDVPPVKAAAETPVAKPPRKRRSKVASAVTDTTEDTTVPETVEGTLIDDLTMDDLAALDLGEW